MLCAVNQGLVEGQAFADAGFFQRLGERILVELLQTNKRHARYDRAFVDDDHGCCAIDLDTHVFEQTRGEQSAQGRSTFFVVVGIPNAKRQCSEDRARVGALQAFNADVFEHKRRHRLRARHAARHHHHHRSHRAQRAIHMERKHQRGVQCRPNKRATSLKRATDIITRRTATPPRCKRASQRSETGLPVSPSKR